MLGHSRGCDSLLMSGSKPSTYVPTVPKKERSHPSSAERFLLGSRDAEVDSNSGLQLQVLAYLHISALSGTIQTFVLRA
uniref:Uncharacterized protein n=1 Tax=Steinernema glaseri TaxID=37863 RepID=A0A1I8AAP4_9BILA